jgi:hypothetical protein
MKDFRVTNSTTTPNIDATATLLIQPRLWTPPGDYPGHLDWRDRAIADVAENRKGAMVAWWGTESVGVCIYQRHANDPSKLEIRNLSIERSAQGRGLAPFLLRQVECEGLIEFPQVEIAVADVKLSNTAMLAFAVRCGYRPHTTTIVKGKSIHNGEPEVVLVKRLKPSKP